MVLAAMKSDKRAEIEARERLAARNGGLVPPVARQEMMPTVKLAGGETTLVVKRGRGRPRKNPLQHLVPTREVERVGDSDGDIEVNRDVSMNES